MKSQCSYINFNDISISAKYKLPEKLKTNIKFLLTKDMIFKSQIQPECISKITFLEYFDIPLLIAERLYSIFFSENPHVDYLNGNSFINQLDIFLHPNNYQQLMTLCFQIYDFDNDGHIELMDARIVWYNVLYYQELKSSDMMMINKQTDSFFIDRELSSIFTLKKLDFKSFMAYNKDKSSDLFMLVYYHLSKIEQFLFDCVDNLKKFAIEESDINSAKNNNEENILRSSKLVQYFSSDVDSDSTRYTKPHLEILPMKRKQNEISLRKVDKDETVNPRKISQQRISNAYFAKENNFSIGTLQLDNPTQATRPSEIRYKKLSPVLGIYKLGHKSKEPSSRLKNSKKVKESILQLNPASILYSPKNMVLKNPMKKNVTNLILSANDSSLAQSISISPHARPIAQDIYSGYIRKLNINKTETRKFYFVLKNHKLVYYPDNESSKPRGIISILRCFIKSEGKLKFSSECYWGIGLYHNVTKEILFIEDESEYEKWMNALTYALSLTHRATLGNYKLLDYIGQGKFSIVHRGINLLTNSKVAVKIIRKTKLSKVDLESIRREISILKICVHESIIKFKEYDENYEYIYIIQDLFEDSIDLETYLENLHFSIHEIQAKRIISKVLSVLEYLHSFGIVHRDIKADNILIREVNQKGNEKEKDIEIKVIDFGLSRFLSNNEYVQGEAFGTLSYAAPEILLNKHYSISVDLFSVGVLSYLLLVGHLPFVGETEEEVWKKTVECNVKYDRKSRNISKEGKDFINGLLVKDIKQRYTLDDAKNHPWLNQ